MGVLAMSFIKWLLAQRARFDLVGEVAHQIIRREWPESDYLLTFRVRLALEEASPVAFRALYLAWDEWEASKHLPPLNAPGVKGDN